MMKLKEPSNEDIEDNETKDALNKKSDINNNKNDDKKATKKKSDSDDTHKDREESKEKRKKEKSDEDDDDKTKKKKKLKKGSVIESKIDSAEDNVKAKEDPLKDKKRHKFLKKIISHLCLLVFILAFQSLVLGLAAQYFYDGKDHLFVYGMFSIVQLIGAPIGFIAIQSGNRLMLLLCVIFNGIWIIVVVVMLLYYWLIGGNKQFDQEIALHVNAVFFISASLTLGVCCIIMMKQISMINISSTPSQNKDQEKA